MILFVTNKNEFTHQDRFDGVDYTFPPGQSIPVEETAARHMFGYGLPDKHAILHRLGWSMYYDETKKHFVNDEKGPIKLAKFIFTKGEYVQVGARRGKAPEEAPVETGELIDESPI